MSNDAPTSTTLNYTDAHGLRIFARHWKTNPPPVGVVHIAHGVGEHSGRYEATAHALTEAGFEVYADDHRGHGETGREQWHNDLSKLGGLGPGGLRATEAAMLQLTERIRREHPSLPLTLLGHSWGSLMAQRILNRAPNTWDAVVLSGSALRTPRFMESGDLNARWRGPHANGFEWLSRDSTVAQRFLADPLCFPANIPKLFGLPDALRLFGTPRRTVRVPLRIFSGSDDPLSRGSGVLRLAAAYRARGARDVTVRVYRGGRHEMLNEINRDEVTAELIAWLQDRASTTRTRGVPNNPLP